jgi:radical SAM superfamily enzyme
MKLMIVSLLLLMVSGCQSVPKLTVGHHALGTPEEEVLSEFLARADITVSLGYAAGHYTVGKKVTYGIDLVDIEQAISALKRKRLAVVHEQINYSPEHNDHEKAKVLSLLRAKSFDIVVITSGTGNRGGTHILEVIRKDGT